MTGPYETEAQARETPAVQAVYQTFDAAPRQGGMDEPSHRLLCEALTAAGVELGAYDHRIVRWLSQWEPETCAVIAGLVTRAHLPELAEARAALAGSAVTLDDGQAATAVDALEVAAEYRRYRAGLTCDDCVHHPAELCEDHQADLDTADEYDALTAILSGTGSPGGAS